MSTLVYVGISSFHQMFTAQAVVMDGRLGHIFHGDFFLLSAGVQRQSQIECSAQIHISIFCGLE